MNLNYEIIKLIGKGSYGNVYLVRKKGTHQEYALKKIKLLKLKYEDKLNLITELKIIRYAKSNFILKYVDCFVDNYYLYIITPIYNCDLQHFIYQRQKNNNPFNEDEIWNYIIQLIIGLKYLHKNNIIHRDIKSSNIFIDNNTNKLVIGDFGVSKVLLNTLFANTMVGTPFYMSPEIFKSTDYTNKVDVWSIGCIIVELMTFYPPFYGKTLKELNYNIFKLNFYKDIKKYNYSKYLIDFVYKILTINPLKRPSIDQLFNIPIIKNKLEHFYYNYYNNKLEITRFNDKFKNQGLKNFKNAVNRIKNIDKNQTQKKIIKYPKINQIQNQEYVNNRNQYLKNKYRNNHNYNIITHKKKNYCVLPRI